MQYAKIDNGVLVEFPYTMKSLSRDNNNTNYSSKKTLVEWFDLTKTSETMELVEVVIDDKPTYDLKTQQTILANKPVLVDSVWTLTWTVENVEYSNEIVAVSPRQCRLALIQINKLADVETFIDGLTEPDKSVARTEWEYASSIRRDSPLLATIATGIGLTEQDVDDLFVTATGL